jgi:sialic acid synthase SpsE
MGVHTMEAVGNDVYVIAEAGACGDGKLGLMLRQIDEASESGADAVKFQWTSHALEMSLRRGKAKDDGYREIYRRYLEWPTDWHEQLAVRCDRRGVDYMCAVYLSQDIGTVARYVRHFKVSSFEASDFNFLKAHKTFINNISCRQHLFVSTGLATETDCSLIVGACDWLNQERLVLMQCNSAYPTPLHDMHLSAIHRYERLGMRGYSDHTDPTRTMTGAYAALAGAKFIEAHVRLADSSEVDNDNPDIAHAMNAEQFAQYVKQIREAERVLGIETKHVTESALPMTRYAVQSDQ